MRPPPGYTKAKPGQVCKLRRSLYGLKQASREWNEEFCRKLFAYGFKQSSSDTCLFTKGNGDEFVCLVVYVDDVLITGASLPCIIAFKRYLHQQFTIKDIGEAKYFLGVEIARSSEGTVLCQRKYVLDILSTAGLLSCKPCLTPLPPGVILSQENGEPLQDVEPYRRLVGKLLYLNFTRPDFSYATQQLSQFVAQPTHTHWKAAMHVLRCLKGCPSLGLFIPSVNSMHLEAYCDADWVACPDTRKSLTGMCIFLGDALVSWRCKKQSTVSASSAESEYRAMGSTVREVMWLVALLKDIQILAPLPVPLHCDNMATLHITKNHVFHERTKHLEVDCHVVREAYKSGLIIPQFVGSSSQLADFFTKPHSSPRFILLLSKMGLRDLHNVHHAGGC